MQDVRTPRPAPPVTAAPDTDAAAVARHRRERRIGLAFVLPAALVVAGTYLYPAVATLVYSVTEIDIATYTIEGFVGIHNFVVAVSNDQFVAVALRTMYFGAMVVLLTTVLAFLTALLLNQRFPGATLLRVVVLLPWAVPPVVSGVVWTQMFQPDFGFVNSLLRSVGLPGDTIWLGDPTLALHVIIIAEVWRWLPFASLFLLAGLQTVPRVLQEAAIIDGAGAWRRLRAITIPIMSPMIVPVMVFLFVWAMKAFDTIFVLTRGGPRRGTTTLNYLVYQESFEHFRFGDSAAFAYLLTGITLAVIAGLVLVRRRLRLLSGVEA